jgi:CelD/BcsL family acetyltransferase involved in cellulose biosynthesis
MLEMLDASTRRATWLKDIPNYVVPLPGDFERLKSGLPRNIKESLRKCYNSLRRAGLSFEMKVLDRELELEAGLSNFLELHRARAEVQDTVPHRNAFSNERAREFLRVICRKFAAQGRLRIFQLLIEGRVVATRLAFVCQDTLYLYFSGYDPAYRQYSIMTTLLAEILRSAIETGFAAVNLSTGKDESKLRWRPTEVLYGDVLIVSPMRRSAIAHEITTYGKQKLHDMVVKHRVFDFLARRRD